jgi:hypothetical protein
MKSEKVLTILKILTLLGMAGTWYSLIIAFIPFYFSMTIYVLLSLGFGAAMYPQCKEAHEASPYRRIRRPSDAGNWLEAPVAELDKSTFGELLARRLRRQPELHVVVRHETPKVCTDALYDPELDG